LPETSFWLLQRTWNFLKLNIDLDAISVPNKNTPFSYFPGKYFYSPRKTSSRKEVKIVEPTISWRRELIGPF
jgi:hypothetical protein